MGVPHDFTTFLNALYLSRYLRSVRVLWVRDSGSETRGSIHLLVLYEGPLLEFLECHLQLFLGIHLVTAAVICLRQDHFLNPDLTEQITSALRASIRRLIPY